MKSYRFGNYFAVLTYILFEINLYDVIYYLHVFTLFNIYFKKFRVLK